MPDRWLIFGQYYPEATHAAKIHCMNEQMTGELHVAVLFLQAYTCGEFHMIYFVCFPTCSLVQCLLTHVGGFLFVVEQTGTWLEERRSQNLEVFIICGLLSIFSWTEWCPWQDPSIWSYFEYPSFVIWLNSWSAWSQRHIGWFYMLIRANFDCQQKLPGVPNPMRAVFPAILIIATSDWKLLVSDLSDIGD